MTVTETQNALSRCGFNLVNDSIVDTRVAFYKAIVRHDPTQAENLGGWLNRAESFRVGPAVRLPMPRPARAA